MRLLVVEDDPALRKILVQRLAKDGYAVDGCDNGIDGFDYAISTAYDALILDIMLPGMDGLSLLRALRARGYANGVLMLTARDAIEDRVNGLDAGADDYLVKPFSYDELSARIRALLRKGLPARSTVLRVGQLELDTVSRTAWRNGHLLSLTAKEYAVLEYMMRNVGLTLTSGQIYDHVWNYQGSYDTNLVPVYIGYLRNKIDKNEKIKYIQTVRGFGYVLREAQTGNE